VQIGHQLWGLGIGLLGLRHNVKIGALGFEGLQDGFRLGCSQYLPTAGNNPGELTCSATRPPIFSPKFTKF
jgi:hypothetical protein